MRPPKAVAVAAFTAQLGLAYVAKASASSKGRPTHVEDQMIKMAKRESKACSKALVRSLV